MTKLTVAALALALAFLVSSPLSSSLDAREVARGSFDGLWSIVVSTASGPCGTYRVALRITRGEIEGGSADVDYQLSGSVSHSGSTVVTVSNGSGSATGYGRLRGAHGSGSWRTSGGECEGSWAASRRGEQEG